MFLFANLYYIGANANLWLFSKTTFGSLSGHGTRMCAGRRFAEQDLHVGLTRVLQKYRLELQNPDEKMEQVYETLLFPKHPLKLRFIAR